MPTDDEKAMLDVEEAATFQRDLYLYWWAARELGELGLTSRGFLTRSALRRLRSHWPITDDDRPEVSDPRRYYLRRLLERLGLLRAPTEPSKVSANGGLVAADAEIMARFLAHPLPERLRICTRLWVAGGWWPDGKPTRIASGLHSPIQPRIALARRRLIEMLAALEPGSPVEIPGVQLVEDHAPRIIGATARRKPRDIADERNETMRAALTGPLQWMGLVVRRATSGSGERMMVASQAVLALRTEPDDAIIRETPGRVIIQPNLDIVAYQPLTAPTLFTLDSCATRVSLDRVAHYRLTRNDVTRAQQGGWSEDDIAHRLEMLTGSPLPGAVRVRLADWMRAASRIRLTPQVTLLTTSTPALLDTLLADRSARGWVLRRLEPTLAVVETDKLESLRRWLLARGELPAVESAEQ
jgi:Helicase conserved C-terminal domain